jgi:hypothetical protein
VTIRRLLRPVQTAMHVAEPNTSTANEANKPIQEQNTSDLIQRKNQNEKQKKQNFF